MTCALTPPQLKDLLTAFADATVNKWVGTEEAEVVSVACQVRRANCVQEFDTALSGYLKSENKFEKYADGIPGKTGRVVSRVLQSELSDVDLSHAQDCLGLGYVTYRDDGVDYFHRGARNFFDWSSSTTKVTVGCSTLLLAAIWIANPLAGIIATVAVAGIGTVVGGGAIVKNVVEYANNGNPSAKEELSDLGDASVGFTASAVAFTYPILYIRETWPMGGAGGFHHMMGPGPRPSPVPVPKTSAAAVDAATPAPVKAPAPTEPVAPPPAEPVAPPPPPMATGRYVQGYGGSRFYKVRIFLDDGEIDVFYFDGVSNLVRHAGSDHVLDTPPDICARIPAIVLDILEKRHPGSLGGVTKIDILELQPETAFPLRNPRPVAPPTDIAPKVN